MILSCQNINKSFVTDDVLKDVSFHLEEREKAALIGPNGAGKSTLLKIIMQEMPADSGEVIVAKGKTLGYLAQHQEVSGDNTIYGELLSVKQYLLDMEEKIRTMEQHAQGGVNYSGKCFICHSNCPAEAEATRLKGESEGAAEKAHGEGVAAGIKAQAQQSLNNIAAILAQAGLDRSAVVKTTVFLKDMNDFAAMNEVYAQFFEGPAYPARSAVEVARLPKDVLVEIEAVALL